MKTRLFTPASAAATIGRVRPAAETICRLYRTMRMYLPDVVEPDGRVDPDYFRLLRRLRRQLDFLSREGVVVDDPAGGLFHFPARRSGKPALLCWVVGERGLSHWRRAEEDPGRRRPLDDAGGWEQD